MVARAGAVGIALVIWGCVAAWPALAEQSPEAAIAACLNGGGSNPHACIGVAADACAKTPDGQSTVGESKCAQDEASAWDGRLNTDYKALLGLLKPEVAEDLRKAQRIWVTSRDADCRVPYYFYDGGSIVQILGARCLMDRTAERALLIRSWLQMAKGEDAAQP